MRSVEAEDAVRVVHFLGVGRLSEDLETVTTLFDLDGRAELDFLSGFRTAVCV